jgi:hypothetical protein
MPRQSKNIKPDVMTNIVLITLGEHKLICPQSILGFRQIKNSLGLGPPDMNW